MDTIKVTSSTITTITLNRPKVHNAFNETVIAELSDALKLADKNHNVRTIILNANGPHFCAGADLHWMQKMAKNTFEQNKTDALQLARLLSLITRLSKPIIAVVQGRVMGGGCGLAAACDIILAEANTQFCFSEVKLGLIPATIAPYVIRRIGISTAQRYFITAELLNAKRALAINLIDEIKEKNTLHSSAQELAESILQNGPHAIGKVKKLLNSLYPIDSAMIEFTATELANIRASDEAHIGLNAFFAKQKPTWANES